MYKSLEDCFNSPEARYNDPLEEIHNPVESCFSPPEYEEYEEMLKYLDMNAYPSPNVTKIHNSINQTNPKLKSIYS